MVSAGQNGLPGWTVVEGNIDFGNYLTRGVCTRNCAFEGTSFLDMCGSRKGAIQQTFHTRPGVYELTFAYTEHVHCAPHTNDAMSVWINNEKVDYVDYYGTNEWSNMNWVKFSTYFSVDSETSQTTLKLLSETSSCGCLLIDDVAVRMTEFDRPTTGPTTSNPTTSPTTGPTNEPTPSPTTDPTASPTTSEPTPSPTTSPTASPTPSPTTSPTAS